ncbi:MAG: hypothetical protein JJU27_08070 [Gammaproteobacteria bacterium]|nr:hypothetical protein [Gammaproteobacteria bacterium]
MSARERFRIRLGVLCLLASGIFSAIGLQLRGPIVLPAEDPQRWAEVALLPTHDLAWVILLPSLVIQLFGFLALYAYVKGTAQDTLMFWGMVMSIIGNGLFLPFTGVLAFADPVIAQQYLAGATQVIDISSAAIEGPLGFAFLAASGIILLAGSFLVAAALWLSPRLPTWTALPYLYHAAALTVLAPLSYTIERSGGWVLLIVAIGIVHAVWRHTATPQPATAS